METNVKFRHALNLTELELASFETGINLADGHARHALTGLQEEIVCQLHGMFTQAAEASPVLLDKQAQSSFLTAVGQRTAISEAEVLSCYSSSVAMEIFARSLQARDIRRVALIHPTFDNIPDILRGMGMSLFPVREECLVDGSAWLPPDIEVLFITTPNNPTGAVLPLEALTHWARVCAARGVILALDSSFRGFDRRSQYDHYDILIREGCRFVIMEDTGKLWPTLDLKIGFLAFSPDEQLPLRRIHTDILLGVSPLIMLLVQRFADDARNGGFGELGRFINANRSRLRNRLAVVPSLSFPDPASRISVERLGLPADCTGSAVWHELRRRSVHVLPCRQFFWAEPDAGERFVRLALSRPPEMIETAAVTIRDHFEGG